MCAVDQSFCSVGLILPSQEISSRLFYSFHPQTSHHQARVKKMQTRSDPTNDQARARPSTGTPLATDEEMQELVDQVRQDKEGTRAFRKKYRDIQPKKQEPSRLQLATASQKKEIADRVKQDKEGFKELVKTHQEYLSDPNHHL